MKKDDLLLVIIGLLLLAGMLYTIFFGGEKSMHGVGGRSGLQPDSARTSGYLSGPEMRRPG